MQIKQLNNALWRIRARQNAGLESAVFVVDGKIYQFLAYGEGHQKMESRHPECLVGIYDEYASREQIIEDIECAMRIAHSEAA